MHDDPHPMGRPMGRAKAQILACRSLRSEIAFLRWRKRNDFSPPGPPHLDAPTLEKLTECMRSSRQYLEYGSGGSTVLAAQIVSDLVVTIESDAKFLASVRNAIDNSFKAKMQLLHVDLGTVGRWGKPMFPGSSDMALYAEAPWRSFPNLAPDTVFVDGRYRVACILTSLLRLPDSWEGRIIVDDYTNRRHYHVVEQFGTDISFHGKSLCFRPAKFDRDKCQHILNAHRYDWR